MTDLHIYNARFVDTNIKKYYPHIDLSTLEFYEGFLKKCWTEKYSFPKTYKIEISMDHSEILNTEGKRLCCFIKPFEKYKNLEFEKIFGFTNNCEDYDENKIVAIEYTSDNIDDIKIY
tara:strand:+ start:1971 stop:2324 length:354 start_codon:yes stop_codon:yes gene_type:complete